MSISEMPEDKRSNKLKREGKKLKEIFSSDADMIPEYQNYKLNVRLHSLYTPGTNQAVKELCVLLNRKETYFP